MAEQQQTTLSYIDGYCERNSKPDVMAEPLNLITNLAFVIGAIMIFKLLVRYKLIILKNWDIILLTITLAVIGFGSAAFHSYPDGTTLLLDVLPIAVFIHLYLISFSARVVGLKPIFAIIVLIAFIGLGIFFENNFSRDTLNGTIMYVPTYLSLIIMVLVLCFVKQSPLYIHLINTAVIWTFSLAFRTIDMQLCSYTNQIGTHFMWHLLNAIVLYRLLALLIADKLSRQNA
jgi:hypothetical protein